MPMRQGRQSLYRQILMFRIRKLAFKAEGSEVQSCRACYAIYMQELIVIFACQNLVKLTIVLFNGTVNRLPYQTVN